MTSSSLRGAGSDRFSGALPRLSYRTFKPLEGVEPSPPWFVARAPDPPAGARKLRGGVEPPCLASEAGVRIHRTERELQEGVEPELQSTAKRLIAGNDRSVVHPRPLPYRGSALPRLSYCSEGWTLRDSDPPLRLAGPASSRAGRRAHDGPTESRTRISALRTPRSPIDL